jgi:hypothetical protein
VAGTLRLYQRCLFEDNLRMYPLFGDDMSLLEGSQSYRHDDWPVPDEL